MSDLVTRLIAVRHGETAWNRVSRIQGHTDIPLNEAGQWQARQVGQAVAAEGVDAIYSSDLLRAADTARAIGQAAGLPVQISHHKSAGRANWGRVGESLERIDRANAAGLDVMADVYPYTAGSGPSARIARSSVWRSAAEKRPRVSEITAAASMP